MSEASGASAPSTAPASTGDAAGQVSQATRVAGGEGGDSSAGEQDSPAEAPVAKKFKLKYDGIEEEVDENALLTYAQKHKGSEKKFQEAAKMRKDAEARVEQVNALLEAIKSDPLSVLTDPALGVDVKALAQKVIEDELRELELSPEQKRLRDTEKELNDIKKRYEEEKTQREQQRLKAEEEAYYAKVETDLVDAIGASSLPKAPYVAKRVADIMVTAIEMGKDITAAKATEILENSLRSEFENMDDSTLEKLMGEKIMKRLTKSQVKRIQDSKPKVPATPKVQDVGVSTKSPSKSGDDKPKYSTKDVFKLY